MQKQEHMVHKDERVKLKSDGQDALYAFACAGSEGWVRNLDHDKLGYPMVYIEWDKDHWAYNGEPDRWAFEAHFDKVDNKMSDTPQAPQGGTPEDFAEFVKAYNAWRGTQSEPAKAPEPPAEEVTAEPTGPSDEQYQTLAAKAAEVVQEADSFVIVTVSREYPNGSQHPVLMPRVFNAYKSTEGGLLVEMQLSKLGAIAHEELSVEALRQHLGNPDES